MANSFFKNLFGAILPKPKEEKKVFSPVLKDSEDGSIVLDLNGYTRSLNLNYQFAGETDLINFYREMSYFAAIDSATEDIINEMIVGNEDESPVSIDLDHFTDKNISKETKEKITKEFENVLKLLNFRNKCYEIAKRFYIDGRLYFHKIVKDDEKNEGISELRFIDPRKIRKIREVKTNPNLQGNSYIKIVEEVEEYFIFDNNGLNATNSNAITYTGGKIDVTAICFVHSGLIEPESNTIYSHLHKAIVAYNQLRLLENSAVIYRLTRAPERRVFNVACGNLPPEKADEHVRQQMSRYRNKETYDPTTGSMSSQQLTMAIIDDIWIPKSSNGDSTTIDTLAGGDQLDKIEDLLYFQKKLYKSLNVPISRLESETGFSLGRSTEISRDEVKFKKFIDKLQKRFSLLFHDLLETQLILKKIVTQEEWDDINDDIHYEFLSDSYFAELKEAEMMRERISLAKEAMDLPDFFNKEYISKEILKQTDETIEDMEIDPLQDEFDDSSSNIKPLKSVDEVDTSFSINKEDKPNSSTKEEDL